MTMLKPFETSRMRYFARRRAATTDAPTPSPNPWPAPPDIIFGVRSSAVLIESPVSSTANSRRKVSTSGSSGMNGSSDILLAMIRQVEQVRGHSAVDDELPTIALPLRGQPLSLDQTLNCGQAFRWRNIGDDTWEGVAGGQLWRLRLDGDALVAQTVPTLAPELIRAYLIEYFRLELDLLAVQAALADAHPATAEAISQFGGLRILKQDPLETLLTFTMATATNVPRVTRNVRELCDRFGTIVASLDGSTYHDFPTIDQILAAPVEELYG